MRYIALDFGGSTIDLMGINFYGEVTFRSYESSIGSFSGLEDFFKKNEINLGRVETIFVTGGRTRFFSDVLCRSLDSFSTDRARSGSLDILRSYIPVRRIDEIEAIGRGGWRLFNDRLNSHYGFSSLLVVSMGTGTCMVSVRGLKNSQIDHIEHVGGTGVGGGTFLGLTRLLLGETDIERVMKMFCAGNISKVDLTVQDIVGGGIGKVSADATASNLGRVSKEIAFSKDDLAAGIVNLVGQTIATAAVFAAKAENTPAIILTGKLTRIQPICEVIFKTASMYGIPVFVPENAIYVSVVGAFEEKITFRLPENFYCM